MIILKPHNTSELQQSVLAYIRPNDSRFNCLTSCGTIVPIISCGEVSTLQVVTKAPNHWGFWQSFFGLHSRCHKSNGSSFPVCYPKEQSLCLAFQLRWPPFCPFLPGQNHWWGDLIFTVTFAIINTILRFRWERRTVSRQELVDPCSSPVLLISQRPEPYWDPYRCAGHFYMCGVCCCCCCSRFIRVQSGPSGTQACSWTVNTVSARVPFDSAKRPSLSRSWWAPTARQRYSSLRGLSRQPAPTRTLCKPQGHNGHRATKCVLLSSLHFSLSFPFWLLLSFSTL